MGSGLLLAAALLFCGRAQAQLEDVTPKIHSSRAAERMDAAMAVIGHRASASPADLTAASKAESNPEIRIRLLMAAFTVDVATGVSVSALEAALSGDSSALVRAVAAQTLSRVPRNDSVRQAFLACLTKESDKDVRGSCLTGLSFQPGPDSDKALADAASGSDREMRKRAGLALLMHPKSTANDAVLDRLESDSDSSVAKLIHARRHPAETSTP